MAAKIVVVGDVFAQLSAHAVRLPRPYQTAEGVGFYSALTGRGVLQAIAAARLGASVTFVGRVGQDVNAQLVGQILAQEHITPHLQPDAEHPTGVRMVIAEDSQRTLAVSVRGANDQLSEQDVKSAEEHIRTADMLLTQFAVPFGAVTRALQLAQKHSVRSVLKPTPYQTPPEMLLPLPTVITPNEEELRALAINAANVNTGEQIAVCTLGASGAQWFQRHGGQMKTGRVSGFNVRAVDVSGAGDVFSAGLAVALAEGRALEDAVRFANAAAALSTTQRGDINSAPTRAQVEALIGGGTPNEAASTAE